MSFPRPFDRLRVVSEVEPKRESSEYCKIPVFAILVVLFLSLASCSRAVNTYIESYRSWTAARNTYSLETFDAKIVWSATYLSPEFRESARAVINHLEKVEAGGPAFYPSYLEEHEAGDFLVAVYTPNGYPPVNASADNFWGFTLNLPTGESLLPSSIETVDVTRREKRLFPYINRWSQFYRVKFPVAFLEKPFTLSLRSVGATSFLEWK